MSRITHVAVREVHMPLREGYTIAYETIRETSNVFLKIETDSGLWGFGCAAPDLEVTGETATQVISLFNKQVKPLLVGQHPYQIALLMHQVREACPHSPSLAAMVDMALYDLMAKKAGLPLYQLLGGFRNSIPTSITIGIMPVKETVEKAVEFFQQGFFIFKIKGGLDVEMDIERMFKLRERLGRSVQLRFDGNQGYTHEQTITFVVETRPCNLEIIEQPTPREELELLGKVSDQTPLPIMADESLLNLKDAFKLAKNSWGDMINIKLMKVGGILQALHINSVAKAAGMEAMVGCMDESALGIAAGLHFALACPNVEYADLDGHLDLLDDPAAGTVIIKEGIMYPRTERGIIGDLKLI